MKRCLLMLLSLSISNSYAFDLEKKVEEKFASTISYVDSHQNTVWPGFKLGDMATMSVVDDDIFTPSYVHMYAYHFSPKNTDWQHILVNNKPAYYLDHDAYGLSGSQNGMALVYGQFSIDDQNTAVFIYPLNYVSSYGINHMVSFYIHCRLDSYFYNFFNYFENENDSFNNPQVVKLTYLETNILRQYLADEKANKDELLKDALAVSLYRLSKISQDSLYYHKGLKQSEQIPDYVATKSLHVKDKELLNLIPEWCDMSVSNWEDMYTCESFTREALPGMAYGLGLDRVYGPSWKPEQMTTKSSEEQLLAKAYGLSEGELLSRAERIIADGKYDYAKISSHIDTIILPYLDEMKAAQDGYDAQPGIEMQIDFPNYENPSFKWKHKNADGEENKFYNLTMHHFLVKNAYFEMGLAFDRDDHVVVDMNHASYAKISIIGNDVF